MWTSSENTMALIEEPQKEATSAEQAALLVLFAIVCPTKADDDLPEIETLLH